MDKAEAINKVLEEFDFEDEARLLFRAQLTNIAIFGLTELETFNGLWQRLSDKGISDETINNVLERWTDLVLEEEEGSSDTE